MDTDIKIILDFIIMLMLGLLLYYYHEKEKRLAKSNTNTEVSEEEILKLSEKHSKQSDWISVEKQGYPKEGHGLYECVNMEEKEPSQTILAYDHKFRFGEKVTHYKKRTPLPEN